MALTLLRSVSQNSCELVTERQDLARVCVRHERGCFIVNQAPAFAIIATLAGAVLLAAGEMTTMVGGAP